MSTEHTPGPWHAKQLYGQGRGLALFWTDTNKPGKWQRRLDADLLGGFSAADARVLAAAPNLLAAIDAIEAAWRADDETVLRVAIDAAADVASRARGGA